MDVINLLKGVRSLNEYISITQDLACKHKNGKIQFNMSTVWALKDIRSLEIEYFNRCHDSGAAFILFERLLLLPPSKTWSLLGKELISLIQYWLDAVRKHLISHHPLWWSFLQHVLHFVKELKQKDSSLNKMLVEQTTDSFLDLATRGNLSIIQRCEVLYTFNLYCAGSDKEIRMALRSQFEHYFIRLSTILATCGHLPTQFSILETLLRWLLPRGDKTVRNTAAAKWFPEYLYTRSTVQIFLERSWYNFFQDARDFLNAHNANTDVTSVICRRLSVGRHVLVSGTETGPVWLDMNYANKSITSLLDPRVLEALGAPASNSCETLSIVSDVTLAARLHRESNEVTITVTTTEPPSFYPSSANVFDEGGHEVKIVISSRSDMARVDNALRGIFGDKYEILLDFKNMTSLSPVVVPESIRNSYEEDQRLSHPVKKIKRREHSGYVLLNSRNTVSCRSPSTTSTTSLAQLHDKLVALPHYEFYKDHVRVSAQPELPGVTELTEEDIRSNTDSSTTTLKLRRCGIKRNTTETKKSQSDNETIRRFNTVTDSSDTDGNRSKGSHRDTVKVKAKNSKLREDVIDENSTSCLLPATISTADQSVINDTLERVISKDVNTENIVDLLVQEALQTKNIPENEEKLVDSGINTGDGKKTQDFVENTPNTYTKTCLQKYKTQKSNCTVVSKSTSDESNTEAINDTPISYVNVRKKNLQRQKPVWQQNEKTSEDTKNNNSAFDEQAIEDFFSKHINETKVGDLLISPTLAKKINETSSESDDFDNCLISNTQFNVNVDRFDDIEIFECLNEIVDKICSEFEKCTAFLHLEDKENKNTENVNIAVDKEASLQHNISLINVDNTINQTKETNNEKEIVDNEASVIPDIALKNVDNTLKQTKEINEKETSKTKKPQHNCINLKYTVSKKQKGTKLKTVKNKLNLEPIVKMSPITEVHDETSDLSVKNISSRVTKNDSIKGHVNEDTPRIRKKRKLYSPNAAQISDAPKYDDIEVDTVENHKAPHSELKKRNVTPKSSATCYKELEKERQKYRLRARKSKSETTLSPKSKRNNDLFNKLKDTVESDVKVTLADKKTFGHDIGMFNFTSDSDDEDFKKKKMDLQNRISTTTIESGNSIIITRNKAKNKINYRENESADSTNKTKKNTNTVKRKRTTTRKNPKAKVRKISIESINDLVDEKMRIATPDELNTSLVIEKPKKNYANESVDPAILIPQIELMTDDDFNKKDTIEPIKNRKGTKNTEESGREEKALLEIDQEVTKGKDDDGTISPLPGLVLEKFQPEIFKGDDSLIENMEQKIMKIYQEGPDAINDTNTTQNLLSDNDKNFMSITDELNEIIEESNFRDKKSSNKEDDLKKKTYDSNIESVRNIPEVTLINDRNICGNNSLKDDTSGISSKSARKTRSLKLKNKKEANKSIEVNVEIEKVDSEQANPKSKINKIKSNEKFEEEKIKTNNETESKKNSQCACKEDKNLNSVNLSIFPKQINVSDVSETKSEKSFASVHINAGGDLDRAPPNTEQLSQRFMPRELIDMEESMKKYYISLRREVMDSESSASNAGMKESDYDSEKGVSPVRSVKKLMSDERSKRLPLQNEFNKKPKLCQGNTHDSQNNSETDISSGKTTPRLILKRLSSEDIAQWHSSISISSESKKSEKLTTTGKPVENTHDSQNNSETDVSSGKTTPRLILKRLSSEDIAQWHSSKSTSSESKKSEKLTTTGKPVENKAGKSKRRLICSDTHVSHENENITKIMKYRITRSKKKEADSDAGESNEGQNITKVINKDKRSQKSQDHTPKRSSKRLTIISPIKLFDDMIPKIKSKRQPDTSEEDTNQTKNTSTKNISTSQSIVKSPDVRNYNDSTLDSKQAINTSSIKENSPILNRTTNRSLFGEDKIDVNRRRTQVLIRPLGQEVTLPISIPSISSVDDWFRKWQPDSSEVKRESVEYAIQNIMEKLDTDLAEINEDTTKNFVHLFMKAQMQQKIMKEARQKMFEKSSARMQDLAKMVNTLSEELLEFDNRSQAMETNFMQQFQQQAMEFLRKDAKQKKRMVTLLKEDIQAALDFVQKQGDST